MKRVFMLVICLALCLNFSGCGAENEKSAEPEKTPKPTPVSVPAETPEAEADYSVYGP